MQLPRLLATCGLLLLMALPAAAQTAKSAEAPLSPLPNTRADNRVPEEPPMYGMPYGANLFTGQFSGEQGGQVNPDYVIKPGDRITASTWGAGDSDQSVDMTVDGQGMVFVPKVGPVKVGGVRQSELNQVVSKRVGGNYNENVKVYTNLQGAQPVQVFVSGGVLNPGRYRGDASDSLLYYLDRAQGIDPNRGSYRIIDIMRDGKQLARLDLYDFLMQGIIPAIQLKDNDVIFVHGLGHTVSVIGAVQNPYRFEFHSPTLKGADLVSMARPLPATTHAIINGIRDGQGFSNYLSLEELATTDIRQGDGVEFKSGTLTATLTVAIDGEHLGPQVVVAPADATLKEVLRHVRIDRKLAEIDAIYLRRRSVAVRQKEALQESLRRLEESIIAASPQTETDAKIQTEEAKLVQMFIARAQEVEPEGRVVLSGGEGLNDISLEDGDTIVIPRKTSLVMVNGEVMMPKALVFKPGAGPEYYVNLAGGYTERADEGRFVLARLNGETVADSNDVKPGDEIIVMPEVAFSRLQVTKDVVDILYKVAIAIAVPLRL